jgi:hypothetical protein
MRRLLLSAVVATVLTTSSAEAVAPPPPPDGFAAFYKLFAAAVAKDDQKALAGFTVLSAALDPADSPITFAAFHKRYLTAKERRCLANGKPARDVDGTGTVNYYVFCGQLIYSFTKPSAAGWRLTDLSPAD